MAGNEMSQTAEKKNPKLWQQIKSKITRAAKGGRAGQWSARKAQLAVQEYKKRGGGYRRAKSRDNSLAQWTEEKWGTKSGKRSIDTGERYLPKKARERLSDKEYDRSTKKKQVDTRKGRQFSRQPADVARKSAAYRDTGKSAATRSKADLYAQAKRKNISGRSRMSREELAHAVGVR
jgi:hypothetical protein